MVTLTPTLRHRHPSVVGILRSWCLRSATASTPLVFSFCSVAVLGFGWGLLCLLMVGLVSVPRLRCGCLIYVTANPMQHHQNKPRDGNSAKAENKRLGACAPHSLNIPTTTGRDVSVWGRVSSVAESAVFRSVSGAVPFRVSCLLHYGCCVILRPLSAG